MALKNSGYTGQNSLHDITGACDLCGLVSDSEVSEVVALDHVRTCRMARRSASHDARSESTMTPSQSRMRCVK